MTVVKKWEWETESKKKQNRQTDIQTYSKDKQIGIGRHTVRETRRQKYIITYIITEEERQTGKQWRILIEKEGAMGVGEFLLWNHLHCSKI